MFIKKSKLILPNQIITFYYSNGKTFQCETRILKSTHD